MAYIHYTGYCPDCRRYFTKEKTCPKCDKPLKRCSRWIETYRVVENGEIKQKKSKAYETKAELDVASRKRLSAQLDKPSNKITFEELANAYIEHAKTRLKASSVYDMKNKLELHILPTFGKKRVIDITSYDILKWQQSKENYSFNYKTTLRTFLAVILKYGYRYHDTPNPMDKVEPFRNTGKKPTQNVWSLEEFEQFIQVVDNPTYRMFWTILYWSGMRKGEALALTWDDIDTVINVDKNLSRRTEESYIITTPKNESSNRKIPLPTKVMDELLDYKKWQKKNIKNTKFVFGGGTPLPDSNIQRYFSNYCEQAKVTRIRQHDFRHSHASYLISKGVSIVAVSKRLGHTNVTQTLDTYAHLMPSDDDTISRAINI